MTTITRVQVQKIIDAADAVITALAGTNDDVHPDNHQKMCQLYDELNDRYATPEIVRELARIALQSLDAKPIAWTDNDELDDARKGYSAYLFALDGEANKFADPRRKVMLYATPVLPKQPDVTLTNEGDITKIIKAAEKLVRCKGRYHSEQNYRALAALFGVTVPDLPPLPSDETPAQPVIPRELRSFVTDADIAALHRFAECCDDPESGGHDLEKEQVQRLEKIGALQRSGRISYITDFGDYLISVTADKRYRSEG